MPDRAARTARRGLRRWLVPLLAAGLPGACASTPEPSGGFAGSWLVDGALRPSSPAAGAGPLRTPPRIAVVLDGYLQGAR